MHTHSLSLSLSYTHMHTNTPWISARSDLTFLSLFFFFTTAFDLWCAIHCINYVSRLGTNAMNTFECLIGAGSARGGLEDGCRRCMYAPHRSCMHSHKGFYSKAGICGSLLQSGGRREAIFHSPETCASCRIECWRGGGAHKMDVAWIRHKLSWSEQTQQRGTMAEILI